MDFNIYFKNRNVFEFYSKPATGRVWKNIDKKAIRDANKNIEWLKSEYIITAKFSLQNLDSKKTPDNQFSAIATETPLGTVLKKKPSDKQAKKIIQDWLQWFNMPPRSVM